LADIFKALTSSRETWFRKAMHLFDRGGLDDSVWSELEEVLIAADVGFETTEKLVAGVKRRVKEEKINSGEKARNALKAEMVSLLRVERRVVAAESLPKVMLVVGVNGGGKTTTAAKLAYRDKQAGKKVLLAAADTFRAAAIDQLRNLGAQISVDVISHQPGADAGAVVFDALQAARSRGADEVIRAPAGRLRPKVNLREELKKLKRVAAKVDATAPHEVILVMDATTGQNGLTQAKYFTQAVDVTSIVLTKLDGTARGGIVLAICDQLGIPVEFVGTGDNMDDLSPFDAATFVEVLCS